MHRFSTHTVEDRTLQTRIEESRLGRTNIIKEMCDYAATQAPLAQSRGKFFETLVEMAQDAEITADMKSRKS